MRSAHFLFHDYELNADRIGAAAQLPESIVTNWQRFSTGLWRVPKGDIQAAYCADTFPKIKVFMHDGHLFTNCGGHFSGPSASGSGLLSVDSSG